MELILKFHGFSYICLLFAFAEGQSTFNGSVASYVYDILNSPSYNRLERPSLNEGNPVVVDMDMFIHSISNINQMSMDMMVNVFLREEWVDPRLQLADILNITESTILHYDMRDRLWLPDIFISNEKISGKVHDITTPNVLLELKPNGGLFLSQRISTVLSCPMDLLNYPLDTQTCSITFEVYGHRSHDVRMRWNPHKDESVQINDKLELPEFRITDYDVSDCSKNYTFTGSFSCINADIHIKRIFAYFLTQVYLPSTLVVVLSWVSFWIDMHAVPARISVGLLTVLTISTQASSINSNMPRVSYVKAIDAWVFTCILFIFSAFVEYAIVNVLVRRKQLQDIQEGRAKFPKVAFAYHNLKKQKKLQDSTAKTEKNNSETTTEAKADIKGNTGNGEVAVKGHRSLRERWRAWKTRIQSSPALLLDVICRVFFPTCFILFNIVYWSYYINQMG